ncbi:MAG: alpha/beta hydrolase [Kofleriaceae bacterium]|nr:alpha/beta hydrolase [Kofleriaceae bacterium]
MARFLIVPGWAGSGPDHWQSYWEEDLAGATRVEMPDWLEPRREGWIAALDAAIASCREPPILVAHSLGCIAIAHWAARRRRTIRGALLVAPADVDRSTAVLAEFAPVPRHTLPFPSRVVASDDDPYATLERSRELARDWGSAFTVLERAGHINAASGLGRWREGHVLLPA